MDKATQKSIEWQKANNPMAIGGDAFVDMIDSFNVNPAYVAGYKEAEKDLELTKDDVWRIFNLVRELQVKYFTTDGCLQEVADIFNEQRKNEIH